MSELNESQINYAIDLDSLSWEQLQQLKERMDYTVKSKEEAFERWYEGWHYTCEPYDPDIPFSEDDPEVPFSAGWDACNEQLNHKIQTIYKKDTEVRLAVQQALGDTEGKLTTEELIERVRGLSSSLEWYRSRIELLQKAQRRFGEGRERTLLCDIIANGQMLPDKNRYPKE